MTFWCIFRSPLMFGGDLPSLDDPTLALITNEDVLEMHAKAQNVHQFIKDDTSLAVCAENGMAKYLAVFSTKDEGNLEVDIPLSALGFGRKASAKDLWSGEKFKLHESVRITLAPHACVLLKIK